MSPVTMDLAHAVNGLIGVAAAMFGVHAIVVKRFSWYLDEADAQVWWYGWRAVVAGCGVLANGVFFLAAVFNIVHLDLIH